LNKRDDILKATLDLIVKEGLHSVTLSKIRKNADVGSGTLYNYFSSKDELIMTLYLDLRSKMGENVLKDYNPSDYVRVQFDKFIRNFYFYCLDHLDEVNFVEQYTFYLHKECKTLEEGDNGFVKTIMRILENGKSQKVIVQKDVHLLFQVVYGIVLTVVKGITAKKFKMKEGDVSDLTDICWNSISY